MIPGYHLVQIIYESRQFIIARVSRKKDNANFILKVFAQETLTKAALKKLMDEYSYACQVESDYVIKYYDLYEYSTNAVGHGVSERADSPGQPQRRMF